MKTIDFLETLLPDIKAYLEKTDLPNKEAFADFLIHAQPKNQSVIEADSAIHMMKGYDNEAASIAFHVARLSKYAKYYVKDALKDTPLLGMDDFGFLASVVENGQQSKSALIAFNVAEIPTGMDIIKRLIKNELLAEAVNKHDRREKLVVATDLGRQTFFKATQGMGKVGAVICGKLTPEERKRLLGLLERLDHFHENIYKENKLYNLDSIAANYL